jgi:dienelactone hydrolase
MIQEKIVVGADGEFPLDGLLTIPEGGSAPYPAVVLVHGSGSSDMDSRVYAVRPFKDMAEGLAEHGVASIRYDKRTFAYVKKLKKINRKDKTYMKGFTVKEEAIEDAILAANMLLNDSRIDPGRVFIAGISLGGFLVPRIETQAKCFAGIIMLSAPAHRMEEVLKAQAKEFLETTKSPIRRWLCKKQIEAVHKKFSDIYNISDEKAKNTPAFNGTSLYYLKDMGQKQVSEYLSEISKPILVMQGDGDFQVPVQTEFNEYKRILEHHPNVTFKLYPGLNHVFMPVVHGDIKRVKAEYSKPQHVADYVISDIAQWINAIAVNK